MKIIIGIKQVPDTTVSSVGGTPPVTVVDTSTTGTEILPTIT